MRAVLCCCLLLLITGCPSKPDPPGSVKDELTHNETSPPTTPPANWGETKEAGSMFGDMEVQVFEQEEPSPGSKLVMDPGVKPDVVATSIMRKPIYPFAAKTVVYSPTGKQLALGTGEGAIHLYNLETGDLERTITSAHDNWAFDLVYSKDGSKLYSAGGDNKAKVWDAKSGTELASFTDHTQDVHGIALINDGKEFITGGDDKKILIRDVEKETSTELGTHEKQVTSISINGEGTMAASSGRDHLVKLWDLKTRKELKTLKGHTAPVISVVFSNDSKTVVSAGNDNSARIWDVSTGELLQSFKIDGWCHTAIYSADDKMLLTGSANGELLVIQLGSEEPPATLKFETDVADLNHSVDGKEFAAVTAGGDLIRFSFEDGTPQIIARVRIPRDVMPKK